MNQLKALKAGNSKNDLIRAILMYQRALNYYASDAQWVKSYEGKYTWNHSTDKDPTKVAKLVLGINDATLRRL